MRDVQWLDNYKRRDRRRIAIRIFTIHAFTNRPFAGNPAAVCLLEQESRSPDVRWMQAVATEMNLSETAFPRRGRDDRTSLSRWFTPVVEVPLRRHATLASARLLYEEGIVPGDQHAEFETLSGRLSAQKTSAGIEMDFPLQPVTSVADAHLPGALREGLSVPLVEVAAEENRYIVELGDAETLRNFQPNLALLAPLGRGVVVTCRSENPEIDFISRNFRPHRGILEDPVTGISHCSLADFWRPKLGKEAFVACQSSRRGGTVGVRIIGDRVTLTGQAVTVLRGTIDG